MICEGQCKAFVVGHSLRPTASVQCEGDKAVSCGRKAATRASFPPCWCYMAHQCRRSRHRRAHSCCRSWTNARQDIDRQAAERLALMGRAVSVRQSMKRLRRWFSPPAKPSSSSVDLLPRPRRPSYVYVKKCRRLFSCTFFPYNYKYIQMIFLLCFFCQVVTN